MNSSTSTLLLLLCLILAAVFSVSEASLLRSRKQQSRNSNTDNTNNKQSSDKSIRRRQRQLFSNPNNALVQDVNVEESLASMAGDIHSLLTRTMAARQDEGSSNGDDSSNSNMVTLTDEVSGLKIDNYGTNDNDCALEGKVRFTTSKIQGLETFHADNLELVAGSEDYEAITDYRGRVQGYKWNGVWKVTATVDPIVVDVTSQIEIDACGESLDFTTYGGIAVNTTTITAAIRVEGILSKDLSGRITIDEAEVLEQQVQFDSAAQLGGMDSRLPINFEDELFSLVRFLFAKKLERPVLTISPEEAQR